MTTLQELLAILQGGGAAPMPQPGAVGQRAQQQQQLTLDQLQQMFGRRPKLVEQSEFAGPSYAPSGIGFTGGSPFPVDERAAKLQNGIQLATAIVQALRGSGGGGQQQQQSSPAPQPAGGGSGAGGTSQLAPAPDHGDAANQSRAQAAADYVDSLYTAQAQQAAAKAKMAIAMQAADQQHQSAAAQSLADQQQEAQAAAQKAAAEQQAAGPAGIQVPPGSPLAQAAVGQGAQALPQQGASLDAALLAAQQGKQTGAALQQGAQAAAAGGMQSGVPSSLGGLPVNLDPTRMTTQSGIRGEVIPEGPFGYQVVPVPSYSQQVAPNELGPRDIAAARQREEAGATAEKLAQARAAVAAEKTAQLKAYDDARLKIAQGQLDLARSKAAKSTGLNPIQERLTAHLQENRVKVAEKDLSTIDGKIDAVNQLTNTAKNALAAFDKGLSTEPLGSSYGMSSEILQKQIRPNEVAAFTRAAASGILDSLPLLKGSISDKDVKFLRETTIGFGKGDKFNKSTLQRQIEILSDVLPRLQAERERAVSDVNSIYKGVGLGKTISTVPQRERVGNAQNVGPNAAPAGALGGSVLMRRPDGGIVRVPADRVAAAKAAGYMEQ